MESNKRVSGTVTKIKKERRTKKKRKKKCLRTSEENQLKFKISFMKKCKNIVRYYIHRDSNRRSENKQMLNH